MKVIHVQAVVTGDRRLRQAMKFIVLLIQSKRGFYAFVESLSEQVGGLRGFPGEVASAHWFHCLQTYNHN